MRRREFIAATGAAATAGLAGCSAITGAETGTLQTAVSDQPGDITDFETLVLEITTVYAGEGSSGGEDSDDGDGNESDDDSSGESERTTVDIEATEVDLVELQGDASETIGSGELETGEYAYLQLEVGEVVDASLADGGEATVQTPGEAPLKFNESFEIRAGETTSFLADFTPVEQGQSGGYILQPVADEVEVTYEDESTATPTPEPSENGTDDPENSTA
ncbi:DUF4382 domain-containing protein [Salinirubellus salinus]|jgi:hypothetical protein|uniref:DUF4382 domain-containing protein n=1 Tax=Salinirubellus salinus TaxID=1364945 RepID=A0A9E7R222_9EURY|nr:DUF4382 domain-containing protein [Salinirubellus salinus]UWM54161.1 DUF4382 domain-containing protein [Salinirubellus salinus]